MSTSLDNAKMPRLADKLRAQTQPTTQVEKVVKKIKKIIKSKN